MPHRTATQIRKDNLAYIVDTRFNGIPNRLAAHIGVRQPQISRVLDGTRGCGDKLARAIEDGCGLNRGWLDSPHAAGNSVLEKIHQLDPDDRAAIELLVDRLLSAKD